MNFEWDDNKEKINVKKHGIDFSTAALVFNDPDRLERLDDAHSENEEYRYITIGMIANVLTVLFVVYTDRGEAIRIISARRATKREEKIYYDD